MKSIEQVVFDRYLSQQSKAEKYRIDASNYIDWAQIAVREAQRFIPIEESMPEDHEELLLPIKGKHAEITKQVIVQYADGTCAIDSRRNTGDTYNYWFIDHTGIIAWRPLERRL
jgi:hypothetical protein